MLVSEGNHFYISPARHHLWVRVLAPLLTWPGPGWGAPARLQDAAWGRRRAEASAIIGACLKGGRERKHLGKSGTRSRGATCNLGTRCFSSQHSLAPREPVRSSQDPARFETRPPPAQVGIAWAAAWETGFHCFASYPDAQCFLGYPPDPPSAPTLPPPTHTHPKPQSAPCGLQLHTDSLLWKSHTPALGLHPCLVIGLPRWSCRKERRGWGGEASEGNGRWGTG